MNEQQISSIIERVTQQFDINGVPHTPDQLRNCVAAYARLLHETGGDKQGRARTVSIFAKLVERAIDADNPWDWVATELRFEAKVEALGDRVTAATNYLQNRVEIADSDLDLYNDRVSRSAG